MRPLRLLLSLSTSLIAVTLLLYIALGSSQDEELESASLASKKGTFKPLFSFTSPGSLFPPSAIISLTDDNSTFFLARPAAFGPDLPKDGLSGPLWVGSGFGDDTLGKGELGCGDVPGWHDGSNGLLGASEPSRHAKSKTKGAAPFKDEAPKEGSTQDRKVDSSKGIVLDDGTDEHLRPSPRKTYKEPNVDYGDIQSLQESAEMAGKVALLKRGGCGFLAKVQWAQRRGATAVIVGDDVRGGALIRMYAKGDTSNITIPSLFTSHTTAHLLSSLLPTEGTLQESMLGDKATLASGITEKEVDQKKSDKYHNGKSWPLIKGAPKSTHTSSHGEHNHLGSAEDSSHDEAKQPGWFHLFLSALGFDKSKDSPPKAGSRRIPSSGDLDWVDVGDWDDDQKPIKTKPTVLIPASTKASDGFVIGEQDWRDPDLLPLPPSTSGVREAATSTPVSIKASSNALPGSGEYTRAAETNVDFKAWWNRWSGSSKDVSSEAGAKVRSVTSIIGADLKKVKTSPVQSNPHEGLWVTLTPTNVSTSPFFDTLLVLVVSPLVTLTVVYALLLLRSRIRRRRWRAPKSVVERLPVRTYQTISESSSSATPNASSPATPLLQHSPPQPASSVPRPRSGPGSEDPATSSSVQSSSRDREEEKRESGLAAWRRRYGGRQKECVVCLEEYEDGVSQVMSLPCGHEFHADCITPWLVTRRRTCPICKGDVVRSLSQSYNDRLQSPSPTRSPRFLDHEDDVQTQAAETRNDSLSASRPVPIFTSATADYSPLGDDAEAGWSGDDTIQDARDIPESRTTELSSSLRELSSTVSTVVWRGVEAVRNGAGFQRRPPPDDVDRDR